MHSVTISDQTGGERPVRALDLPEAPDRLTLRELIRLRVREEVARFNAGRGEWITRLVEPQEAELARGASRTRPQRIDWEKQADAACRAFTRNRFFVIVGGRQVEELDEEVDLAGDPEVIFLKLIPLVGG